MATLTKILPTKEANSASKPMKVSEFVKAFPLYAIDFSAPVRDQRRIYDGALLDQFPVELEPDHPYHPGGRGRPNLNQTLTHSQCATCKRVLRNDYFYTVPSMMKRNVVFPHCRECNQHHNSRRYITRAEAIQARRIVIWRYLAPACTACGFDKHMSALELHHPEQKEPLVGELIANITLSGDAGKVEALLREASKCVPLCSNCHRMLHAGALQLPADIARPHYQIGDLLTALKSTQNSYVK
jgi:hypothetical protein